MKLSEFYRSAIERKLKLGERLGQAMFNALLEARPELAERVRCTDKDPFHAHGVADPRLERFMQFVDSNW